MDYLQNVVTFVGMKRILIYVGAGLLLLSACKPTEKNYRTAYETAMAREQQDVDPDILRQMKAEELPPMVRVMGDSVRVKRMPIAWYYTPAQVDSGKRISPANYNVCVANYKMPANAKAHAESLAERGFRSAVMSQGQTRFFVMAGMVSTLDSAAHLSSRLLRDYPHEYVGQPCPIAIQPVR